MLRNMLARKIEPVKDDRTLASSSLFPGSQTRYECSRGQSLTTLVTDSPWVWLHERKTAEQLAGINPPTSAAPAIPPEAALIRKAHARLCSTTRTRASSSASALAFLARARAVTWFRDTCPSGGKSCVLRKTNVSTGDPRDSRQRRLSLGCPMVLRYMGRSSDFTIAAELASAKIDARKHAVREGLLHRRRRNNRHRRVIKPAKVKPVTNAIVFRFPEIRFNTMPDMRRAGADIIVAVT
jgi:hypothetical protein